MKDYTLTTKQRQIFNDSIQFVCGGIQGITSIEVYNTVVAATQKDIVADTNLSGKELDDYVEVMLCYRLPIRDDNWRKVC